jgi:hypothetical protein
MYCVCGVLLESSECFIVCMYVAVKVGLCMRDLRDYLFGYLWLALTHRTHSPLKSRCMMTHSDEEKIKGRVVFCFGRPSKRDLACLCRSVPNKMAPCPSLVAPVLRLAYVGGGRVRLGTIAFLLLLLSSCYNIQGCEVFVTRVCCQTVSPPSLLHSRAFSRGFSPLLLTADECLNCLWKMGKR